MPSTRDIRQRIKSVSNTAKVTNAMHLISTVKFKKAQMKVESSKFYANSLMTLISQIIGSMELSDELLSKLPLLKKRPVKKAIMVLITPDRGLAGPLVGNLTKLAVESISSAEFEYEVISLGKKGEKFATQSDDISNLDTAIDVDDFNTTKSLTNYLTKAYINDEIQRIDVLYADYVTPAVQVATLKQLLPIKHSEIEKSVSRDTIFEPNVTTLLGKLLPSYFESQVYQSLLNAEASEHGARMVAMRNATDNAGELIDELTLNLNKARQSTITGELLDIIGGVTALG